MNRAEDLTCLWRKTGPVVACVTLQKVHYKMIIKMILHTVRLKKPAEYFSEWFHSLLRIIPPVSAWQFVQCSPILFSSIFFLVFEREKPKSFSRPSSLCLLLQIAVKGRCRETLHIKGKEDSHCNLCIAWRIYKIHLFIDYDLNSHHVLFLPRGSHLDSFLSPFLC